MNHHIEHDRNRFVESDGWTIAFNLNTTLQSCPIHHSSDYYRSQPIFVFRSLLGIPFDSLPPPVSRHRFTVDGHTVRHARPRSVFPSDSGVSPTDIQVASENQNSRCTQ